MKKPMMKCPICSGNGEYATNFAFLNIDANYNVPCRQCFGHGEIPADAKEMVCPECEGRGYEPFTAGARYGDGCLRCNGTGKVYC